MNAPEDSPAAAARFRLALAHCTARADCVRGKLASGERLDGEHVVDIVDVTAVGTVSAAHDVGQVVTAVTKRSFPSRPKRWSAPSSPMRVSSPLPPSK
jgi:hypothetical protein